MATYDFGNCYVTSGTINGDTVPTDGITVKINNSRWEEDGQETIIEFNIPVSPAKATTQPPLSNLIPLKRVKHVIQITGQLVTETVGGVIETDWEKKINLKVLAGYGGTAEDSTMVGQTMKSSAVKIVRGLSANSSQQIIEGNITKWKFTEAPGKYSDGTPDNRIRVAYDVTLAISVGKERKSSG